MQRAKALRISPVGVRGIVGPGLTVTHALDFAAAFGTLLATDGPVLLGRDPRSSGNMLRAAATSALLACGRDVIDLGIVSTPVIQHAIRRRNAAGGISLGASHNAAEWNALKFLGPAGTYLASSEAGELLDIYHLKKFAFVDWHQIGKLSTADDAIETYLDDLERVFDFARLRQFRVVVDCCNGTSSTILERVRERFAWPLILINARLEGAAFAHEPETSARMVGSQLGPLIQPLAADAGFLFDADADRVACATSRGEALSEELILPLVADGQLAKFPGRLVLTNLSTTALVDEVARRRGGEVIRVPVGRQAAIDALSGYRPEQIALAGEGTGAIMLPQFRFVYDGIAAMLMVLTIMADRGQALHEIAGSFPRYSMLKGEVPLKQMRIPQLYSELRDAFGHQGRADTLDGLRVDWPEQWFHVRVSQTEPLVRVICEAQGDPPQALFDGLMEQVRRLA
ncbi:MAG: hypothetical protein K2X03_24090 [Bryobacteraceae bacterium]|nr:hypothetical protein [Bryobacteraceae bacterium]